jgi:hypothetical protein
LSHYPGFPKAFSLEKMKLPAQAIDFPTISLKILKYTFKKLIKLFVAANNLEIEQLGVNLDYVALMFKNSFTIY